MFLFKEKYFLSSKKLQNIWIKRYKNPTPKVFGYYLKRRTVPQMQLEASKSHQFFCPTRREKTLFYFFGKGAPIINHVTQNQLIHTPQTNRQLFIST